MDPEIAEALAEAEWNAPEWLARLLGLDDGEPVTRSDVEEVWHNLTEPISEALEWRGNSTELAQRAADAIRRGRDQ